MPWTWTSGEVDDSVLFEDGDLIGNHTLQFLWNDTTLLLGLSTRCLLSKMFIICRSFCNIWLPLATSDKGSLIVTALSWDLLILRPDSFSSTRIKVLVLFLKPPTSKCFEFYGLMPSMKYWAARRTKLFGLFTVQIPVIRWLRLISWTLYKAVLTESDF